MRRAICIVEYFFSLGVLDILFLWSMKFCSQNLNHPFLPSVNNVLVIEITPTKALFACFNINQNDKILHISFCAECFIILYRSRECI